MSGVYEAWLLFVVCSSISCYIGALIWSAIRRTDRRRFEQRDWVAEQRRRIDRRAFKSRMGAR